MECEGVEVPATDNPLTPQQIAELRAAVNPLQDCDNLGVSLYLLTRAFVNACM